LTPARLSTAALDASTPAAAVVRTAPALAVRRLLARDRLHPGPDAGVAASHAQDSPAGFVDDLDLELVLYDAEPVERQLLGVVDRTGSDLNPVHG
jgi:hypothetical protein